MRVVDSLTCDYVRGWTRDYGRGWTRGLLDTWIVFVVVVLVVDCGLWIVDCGCTIMA